MTVLELLIPFFMAFMQSRISNVTDLDLTRWNGPAEEGVVLARVLSRRLHGLFEMEAQR